MPKENIQVFKKLWEWRFEKARLLDESPEYIMTKSVLQKIAFKMPDTAKEIQNLKKVISQKTLSFTKEILKIIKKEKQIAIDRAVEDDTEIKFEPKKAVKRSIPNEIGNSS